MPSLREIQHAFMQGVLRGDAAEVTPFIVGDGIAAHERLAIYANNACENFTSTLEAAFPVVLALSGRDWLRQTARAYWREHPSRAGNLHTVGVQFAAYLQAQLADTPYAYFADVAALEWAYQEALVAADHPGFDVAALGTVPPEMYGALQFELHPSVRLVTSMYPVLDIWRAHQPGTACNKVDLSAGPQHMVVVRRADHVQFRAIAPAAWTLLETLAMRNTLAAAAEAALAIDPDFDLAGTLAQFIALGVLVDFSTSSHPPSAIR